MLEACHDAEVKLKTEVPKQDTTAIGEMTRRGLNVTKVSPAAGAQWRAEAEKFAHSMHGVIPTPEILDMAERERNAFRQRSAGNATGGPR